MIRVQDRRWELFKCQMCGRCCTEIGLPWDPWRISEIAQFLNLTVEQVFERYYGRIVVDEDGSIWEEEYGESSRIFGEEASWIPKKEVGREYQEFEDHKRTPCPFLRSEADGTKTCMIYEVRPGGCRAYPFDTDFGSQGVDCPGARIVYERLKQEDR
jgi:Fe-S-cluster containining protein